MSIFGDKFSFAIECQTSRVLNGHLYAHFRLWADGEPIGDFEDEIVLSSCISYLSDFLKFTGNRYEPELDEKSKEEVFQAIFDSVVYTVPFDTNLSEILSSNHIFDAPKPEYENIEERFHLDSIGMSSFSDKFNVILIETKTGKQRLIWRTLFDMKLHEVILEPKIFETVAEQFLVWANLKIREIVINSNDNK